MLVVKGQHEISHPNSPAEWSVQWSSCATIAPLPDIYVKAHFCMVGSPAPLPIHPVWAPAMCREMPPWEEAVGAQSLPLCSELTH